MENIIWQKPALEPTFGMPIYGPSSRAARDAHVCVDAVRVTGLIGGSDAWSPPFS